MKRDGILATQDTGWNTKTQNYRHIYHHRIIYDKKV